LTSLDLSGFNTSNVTDMQNMFYNCEALVSLDVSGFDTSSVTNMASMFANCEALTSLDLSSFDTSNVTDMDSMFYKCAALTSLDVSGFNTSSVTNMHWMFFECNVLTSLDLNNFDTSNVTIMDSMFCNCKALTSLDLSKFDTSSVEDMSYMFYGCNALTLLDISGFDTSCVTNMYCMFYECNALTSLDVSGFDTSCVTNMTSMFAKCESLTSLDVSSFDTSCVTNMNGMFDTCKALTSLDLSKFDTSSVTDMDWMFAYCEGLTTLDLSVFDTASVTDMSYMFYFCESLTSLDLSKFDTSSVTNMSKMFNSCKALASLDLSSFDTSNVTEMKNIFSSSPSLTLLKLGKDFGNVVAAHNLTNGDGWVNANDPSTVVSGSGEFAEINNSGANTYVKYGEIAITEQPPEKVYFDTYEPAKITMPAAVGKDLCYSWYFKTPDRTTFLLDEEFDVDEWTGSYDFYGLTGTNGLTDKYDGTEMYCKIWNRQGAEVETKHFTLKKYQGDVDRNITIRMPEVGETYAHYMADVNSIVPAELIIGDEYFGIIPMDADGNYIPGVNAMTDDDVFKTGYRYEYCFNMHLPEYVSPMAIYQFYSKALIVNGEEHGGADSVDENELYFTDFWTTPLLEGGQVLGDINGDTFIDATDASEVLVEYAATQTGAASTLDKSVADVNNDSFIDAADASCILQYYAYIQTGGKDSFPDFLSAE